METSYRLSSAQEGIWFAQRLAGDRFAYTIAQYTEIAGTLDAGCLLGALQTVVAEAACLRVRLVDQGAVPVQVVTPHMDVPAAVVDVSTAADPETAAQAWMAADLWRPADLLRGGLFGFALLKLGARRHFWYQRYHHLIMDAFGAELIAGRVAAVYTALSRNEPVPDSPFGAFDALLAADESYRESAQCVRDREFWRGYVDGWSGYVGPAGDRPAPPEVPLRHTCVLSQALVARLDAAASRTKVSLHHLLVAAVAATLHRLSGATELLLGVPVLGRTPALRRIPGMAANVLPLRLTVAPDDAIGALAQSVASELRKVLRHQLYRGEHIRRDTHVSQATQFGPAVNIMKFRSGYRFGDSIATNHVLSNGPVEDIAFALNGVGGDGTLPIDVIANPALYALADVQSHMSRVRRMLTAVADAPETRVRAPQLLDAAERRLVITDWNRTPELDPPAACLHTLFEAVAAARPQAPALTDGQATWSYAELNTRASRLAARLIERGVCPDSRVAICADRGMELMLGVLAVLKAGGAYVPLDPAYPAERLEFIVQDSAPVLLLCDRAGHAACRGIAPALPRVALADDARPAGPLAGALDGPACAAATGVTPRHLAYVIYTSGTTGRPKGVMVEHANVVRLFAATRQWFEWHDDDVWTLFHSFAFDFSVWEMWGALLHGGCLAIVPYDVSRSPDAFYSFLCRHRVTVLNQTPSAFRQLAAAQARSAQTHALRYLVFGGEALDPGCLRGWYERNHAARPQLVNMYGITETTVHVTYRALTPDDTGRTGAASPIGIRIPDLRLYLLDAHLQPVPPGVAGEIFVGGAGVARGYLNRPELTAERFLHDPFVAEAGGRARMYRSGDMARYLPDGSLDFLGRNDDQVKLRGYRIELREIKTVIAGAEGVRDAAVIVREDVPGDRRLVAYVQADRGLDSEALRRFATARLPGYMLPAAYVQVERFPLTPNGKLDIRALPAPGANAHAHRVYEAPIGPVERAVAALWQEILRADRVGRQDNFFELGGHSLLAVTVLDRMRSLGLHADIRALFTADSLAAFAGAVQSESSLVAVPDNRIPDACERIAPAMLPLVSLSQPEIDRIVARIPGGAPNVKDIYPLAPLQRGILFHRLFARAHDVYRVQIGFELDSRERVAKFIAALRIVIQRHDLFRTAVMWERLSQPVQVVQRHAELAVDEVCLGQAACGALAALLDDRYLENATLDVRRAPIIRILFGKDPAGDRWLLRWVTHHLVDDITTLKIAMREIRELMRDPHARLAPPVPFRLFVAQAYLGISRDEHEAFFRAMLRDIREPTAPFGLTEIMGDGASLQETTCELALPLVQRLRRRARALGVSVGSLCHLAFALVLARVSGHTSPVFGTVLAGRSAVAEGADRTLGVFINTLPVRIDVDTSAVAESAARVHDLLAQILRHEHAPLALAQRCSAVKPPAPLFAALFNYRHVSGVFGGVEERWEGVRQIHFEERSNYALMMTVNDDGAAMSIAAQMREAAKTRIVCDLFASALDGLADALDRAPRRPLIEIGAVTEPAVPAPGRAVPAAPCRVAEPA